jgi:biotin operon repressor
MDTQDLGSLLERIGAIREACDLDLLLFFHRHPRALLTGEELAASLGYDRERIANSIEGLIEAGLLTRSQSPSHAAQLYALELGGDLGPLSSLLRIASTREGRLGVKQLLQSSPTKLA